MKRVVSLDEYMIQAARDLSARQPRMDNSIPQLPSTNPTLSDLTVISRPQAVPGGGYDYGVTLQQIQTLIGGGGSGGFAYNTDLSALSIYNYGFYTVTPGGTTTQNVTALNSMFNAINARTGTQGIGGWVWIPEYEYQVTGATTGITVPCGIVMQGLGTGGNGIGGFGSFYHFVISDTGGAATAFLSITGPHSSGGTEMRNVSFNWSAPAYQYDTAVINNMWSGRLYGCTFHNCPTAIFVPNGLQTTIESCQIVYEAGMPNNATAVFMSGEQGKIIGSGEFLITGQDSGSPAGPTGCTAVAIGGPAAGSEHQEIRSIHFANWAIGIDFADNNGYASASNPVSLPYQGGGGVTGSGCEFAIIDGNEFQCTNYSIYLSVNNANADTRGVKIINNNMAKAHDSQTAGACLFIGTFTGAGYAAISQVDIIGNEMFGDVRSSDAGNHHTGIAQNNTYGININSGDGIGIIGGKIGNFGNQANIYADGSANIAITGNCGTVIIDGVKLQPSYPGAGAGNNGSCPSMCAFRVTSGVTSLNGTIQVKNCDMNNFTNSGQSPVIVDPAAVIASNQLYIYDCPGYNDSGFIIAQGVGSGHVPLSATQAAGASSLTGGANYYGSSIVYGTNTGSATTVTIDSNTTVLLSNQSYFFFLRSPWEHIQFSQAPTTFNWLGK